MSIVSSANIISYLDVSTYDASIQAIHESVEAYLKQATNQPWESTTYTNKAYNGTDGSILLLEEKPIISVKSVIIDPYDAIKISNSMTDASLASVVIDAANVTLTVEGGAGNGTSTLAKSTYTTLTLLIAAINALSANGWSAEIVDSHYNSLKTSYLFDQQYDVTQEAGIANQYEYIQFGENAENVKINKSSGQLLCSYFPRGFQNVIVTYTAGYSTIPADITLWIMNTVKTLYMVKLNSVEGITSFRVGDISYTYGEIAKAGINIPDSILKLNVNLRI